jgi:hypothetical protein
VEIVPVDTTRTRDCIRALEAFLDRAVAAAQKTQRFGGEWRRLQRLFPRMKLAWEQGHTLFQADLAHATTHQEEMEYFSMIDFAEDCYAYVNARKTYPDDAACQAWATNGYMVAWWQHFFQMRIYPRNKRYP